MRTVLWALAVGLVLALALAGPAVHANSGVKDGEPAMMVSPQTIVLAKVDQVTVHTNIPAAAVDRTSLALEGVPAGSTWVDDCGHIAARWAVADLPLSPARAVVLTLTGSYDDGTPFAAQDTVQVK